MLSKEIAIVNWTDAALYGNDTFSEKDLEDVSLICGIAVGVIVKEDDVSITLATDWFYNAGTYRQLATYPKSGISSIIKKTIKTRN